MLINIVSVIIVLIGSVVIWTTPIRKNKAIFRKINLIFAIGLGFVKYFNPSPVLGSFSTVLIIIFCALSLKPRKVMSSNESLNSSKVSRQNLGMWWFLIGLVFIAGSVAYLLDMNNPSDSDRLFGTNDSATIIFGGTFIVLGILGIGARFSYLRYSRVNQADLIADAIKSHVQPPSSGSLVTPAKPSLQTPPNLEDRLRKLASLLADGLISNDDFETKKQQIIDSL